LKNARWLIGASACLVVAACGEETGPNISGVPSLGIWEVAVSPTNLTILVPDTITAADFVQFSAAAISRSGQPVGVQAFAWRTSDESIAIIDENGLVVPIRPGTVEIHASAHKIGKATLVILPATETVVVTPARDTILVDEPIVPGRDTLRLKAEAFDAFGVKRPGVAFTWQSNSNAVVTVDENGTAHASGLGTTSVLATANSRFAASQIHILPVVASVSLSSPVTHALVSDTIPLTAVARSYNNAVMSRVFNWTSSNTGVATVDSLGNVFVTGLGQATITARTAHRSASVNITTHERRLTAMDGGTDFTCGVAELGRGYCWGLTPDGQTASQPDSICIVGGVTAGCTLPPKQMERPEISYTTISAGGNFACGVAIDQNLYCWGNNLFGQLGNGLRTSGSTPALASVKSERFTTVSAGERHACALNLVGTAYCWGSDSKGQLGDYRDLNNLTLHSTTPIPVADTALSFKAISAGETHTCAVTQTGIAYCWGSNAAGQLGNGQKIDSDIPVQVSGANTFIAIAAGGAHTCGVTTSGNMLCWGNNADGQVGKGVANDTVLVPTTVSGGGGYSQVSAGQHHTCGLGGGVVRCWGNNESGQIGNGVFSGSDVPAPVTVAGLQAVSISLGNRHSCAIGFDNRAWCWGSNRWGALGNEFQAAIRPTPQLVARPR
jgi:alpha-tubulin suppressor-like RCC1 family protein